MRIRKMVWVNDPQVPRISVDSIGMQRCLINIEPTDKRAETVQICRRLPFLYVQLGGVHDTPPTLSWRVKVEHPKAKGEKTEAILIAEFVKRDFKVLKSRLTNSAMRIASVFSPFALGCSTLTLHDRVGGVSWTPPNCTYKNGSRRQI